jgi:hypothetical protein
MSFAHFGGDFKAWETLKENFEACETLKESSLTKTLNGSTFFVCILQYVGGESLEGLPKHSKACE